MAATDLVMARDTCARFTEADISLYLIEARQIARQQLPAPRSMMDLTITLATGDRRDPSGPDAPHRIRADIIVDAIVWVSARRPARLCRVHGKYKILANRKRADACADFMTGETPATVRIGNRLSQRNRLR